MMQKPRFTGKFLVKRAFTVIIVNSHFTVFYSEKTVKIEIFMEWSPNQRFPEEE
jgi:hypothetical protein